MSKDALLQEEPFFEKSAVRTAFILQKYRIRLRPPRDGEF